MGAPARNPTRSSRSADTNGPEAAFDAECNALAGLGDLLSDGLVVADSEGKVRYANPEALRMLGAPGTWVRGRATGEVLRTAVPGADPLADAKSGDPQVEETLLLTKAGNEVPARVTLRRLASGGSCAALRDLTQDQRLQRELRLRERLATVGELAAGVAHEIRNPLAGISSAAQVLLTRFEPRDDRQKFCRVIIEQVDRLDHTVTSLLKFARPPEPQLRPTLLPDVIERVLTLEAERLAEGKVAVERRYAARVPTLHLDPGLIEQVLLNLVQNAVQAMPGGGSLALELGLATRRTRGAERSRGRRSLDASPATAAGEAGRSGAADEIPVVRLRLLDTGQGVPKEVLPRLFDPFFTTRASGTGLGLSISQSIIQEHGGAISIASREGRGTTVIIEFPLEKRHGQRREDAR